MPMRRKRPENKMVEVMQKTPAVTGPIDKRFTIVKAGGDAESPAGSTGQMFVPTDEQLAKINQFTARPVTADEVACFTTMSCNDILDRDLDRFTTDAVKQFAKLPGSRSPIGKSFMVSHDTTKLPVGRIFDAGNKKMVNEEAGDGSMANFLTNEVFIPRLDSNKDFIGNMEFGVYWAVSVGVMMGAGLCSIGEPHAYNGRWWCSQGHEKGLYYDPKSDEKDAWGWPEPVDSTEKGAVLCTRDLTDPKDFYELSMVYLGAQYMAELATKDPEMDGIIKAASARSIPIVGLRNSEARKLPFQHVNEKVADAYRLFKVTDDGEGRLSWVDDRNLVYTYDPDDDLVQCMGLANDIGKSTVDRAALLERFKSIRTAFAALQPTLAAHVAAKGEGEGEEGSDDEDPQELAEQLSALVGTMRTNLEAEDYEALSGNLDEAETTLSSLTDALGVEAEAESEEDEGEEEDTGEEEETDESKGAKNVSRKRVLAAAKAAGLPSSITDKLIEADDETALSVVMSAVGEHVGTLQKTVDEQQPLATAGEKYLKDLRASVLNAYVKAFQLGSDKGADTSQVQKFIDRCGDDPDLLNELRRQYEQTAEGKLPKPVRRSTFDTDANSPNLSSLPGNLNGDKATKEEPQSDRRRLSPVARIHGG
jgi:hypothetical protein